MMESEFLSIPSENFIPFRLNAKQKLLRAIEGERVGLLGGLVELLRRMTLKCAIKASSKIVLQY